MGTLHRCFENTITKIGFENSKFPVAVFYSTPIGIRFEIGGQEKVYLPGSQEMNPAYIRKAFQRAVTLFCDLPCQPNILRIDSYPEEENKITPQILSQLDLPVPDESTIEKQIEDGDIFLQEHLYWDLAKRKYQIDKLLLEIIKGEIGGFSNLSSNVYIISTERPLLYHLYDDRGADIVANDKKLLLPLYKQHKDWILQYDKARITQQFTEAT